MLRQKGFVGALSEKIGVFYGEKTQTEWFQCTWFQRT